MALDRRERAAAGRPIQHVFAEGLIVLALLGWWSMSSDKPPVTVPEPQTVARGFFELFTDLATLGKLNST